MAFLALGKEEAAGEQLVKGPPRPNQLEASGSPKGVKKKKSLGGILHVALLPHYSSGQPLIWNV